MANKCFFSIIIPIYNNEIFVTECINSILKQNFSDFECILVNDGSTDNSELIIKNLIVNDNRFHYIYQSNQGVYKARQVGAELASGKYLVFIDSDDSLSAPPSL